MADRSIELLNKLLGYFTKTGDEYKDLIGDASKDDRGWIMGTADLSSPIDLSINYNLKLDVDSGGPWTVNCQGSGSPTGAATTGAEIVSAINTAVGVTVASLIVYPTTSKSTLAGKTVLLIRSTTDGSGSLLEFTPPASLDAIDLILGLTITSGYDFKYPDPANRRIGDFDMGSVSNSVEYLRQYNSMLIAFMVVTSAEGGWLDFWGFNVYGIQRPEGMGDDKYRTYFLNRLTHPNSSPPAIRYALDRTFGDANKYADHVEIVEGMDDGMFADVSFSDVYREWPVGTSPAPYDDQVIKAALTGMRGGMPLFFRVIMEGNVLPSDYKTIIDTIEWLRAGGTTYLVEVLP